MSDPIKRHENTAAVITGGAQGAGQAIARRLVAEGCNRLVLAGRDADKGERAVAELSQSGRTVRFVALDLQDVEACLRLIDTAVAELGAVDALVNAAALGARGTLVDTSPELWDR